MLRFTDHYVDINNPDITALPYRDYYTALRHVNAFAGWAAGHPKERHMRDGLRYVVDCALGQLRQTGHPVV